MVTRQKVKEKDKKDSFPLPRHSPDRHSFKIPLYLMGIAFGISYNVKTNEARPKAAGTSNKGWNLCHA